jgi:hypothetical protein
MACLACRYNIAAYVNADPRQIQLFMLQCELDASMLKNKSDIPKLGILFVLLFVGFLIFGCIWDNNKGREYIKNLKSREAIPTRVEPSNDEIWTTMKKVTIALNKRTDVNNDGEINCIDASVLFYQYFPDKSRVCIEVNYNPKTQWYHSFNCIKINGIWRAIEPQSHWKGHSSYWMRDIWPNNYEAKNNQDKTEKYKVYVK